MNRITRSHAEQIAAALHRPGELEPARRLIADAEASPDDADTLRLGQWIAMLGRDLLIDAERQAAGDFGKPGVDLAQSQRRPVFDAEGFHLVRHRATRRIEGGVEAVHEAIEALFPLVGPVAGQALVMLHIGDRLGPGELEKPLVLAPIPL